MKLRNKTFAAFLGFIVVPLLALGVAAYLLLQSTIAKKYGEQTELTLRAVGSNVASVFKEANALSDTFYSIFMMRTPVIDMQNASSMLEVYESERNLRSILLSYPSLQSVSFYQLDGGMIGVDLDRKQRVAFSDLSQDPLYREAHELNGFPLWLGPYENKRLSGGGDVLTQLRMVRDFNTLTVKGTMLLQLHMDDLRQLFRSYDKGGGNRHRFLLVDPLGTVIFDNDEALIGKPLPFAAGPEPYTSRVMPFDNVRSLVSVYRLELDALGVKGWSVVSIASWKHLSGETNVLMGWVAAVTFGCVVFALLFNMLFVNRIIRLLLRVVQSMRSVERGDFLVRVPVRGRDETSFLANGFNRLVERVERLLSDVKREQDRKNKAEFMLLQAQIKPHFLYNTLESINALAMQNEGRKVSQMVVRLGNMLRLSIHQQEEIRLRQEIDHLKNYLDIQMYRFEDLFDYTIDAPDELMDCTVQKLTLQPLVENAIQHGFDGIDYRGKLNIAVAEENGRIAITVSDNGVGIPAERLARFRYHSQQAGGDQEAPATAGHSGEGGGLGVNNVADRIRIHYGDEYGLFLCSAPGWGTTIKCTIPKQPPQAEMEAGA
ncbi:MAG: sensor histidine kinase [Paenibacillaceae bacterium]|nr:sensor histidine kinase [Paenibacillaceae bacterium]